VNIDACWQAIHDIALNNNLMCKSIDTHVYVYTHIHAFIHTNTHTHTYICVFFFVQTHTDVCSQSSEFFGCNSFFICEKALQEQNWLFWRKR